MHRWFFVDIPLLFETHAEAHLSAVVVVACAAATQRARLLGPRQLSPALAEQIIASQLDLETKIKKTDHLIWNDSTTSCLDRQAALLAGWLRDRYA
jgi:dephospho-CoA kinase